MACHYSPESREWNNFFVNEYQNDLERLIKYYEVNRHCYFVGFNNLNFDGQVQEFILRNYENWFDKSNSEISSIISKFASDLIDDMNYNLFPPYKETDLTYKQIDVPRVMHWFNENKRVSLVDLGSH
jgi:hypothetical protein